VPGEYLVTHESPQKADAIIVLGGEIPTRGLTAADLYRQGLAAMVLVSPGRSSPRRKETISELKIELPNDADLNRRVLIRLGVPPTAIHEIDEAEGTIGEARALQAIVPRLGIRSVLVVTSKYHTRRAGMTFRRVLGDSVQVQAIGSSYDDFQPSRWWQDRHDAHHLILEYQKLLLFTFESLQSS
jgi:uncharacterized SAM-binding protein YcdF (DUF218 family)